MDHPQRQGADPASFARVWNRVSAANGGSQIEIQKPAEQGAPSAQGQEEFLHRRILAELADHRTCARLAGGSFGGQMIRAIAGDKLSQARRLSAACFLLTGKWFFPLREAAPLPFQNWQEGMRTVFLRAGQGAEEYHGAAEQAEDPSLRDLFRRLAEEERLHALRIQNTLAHWG